MTFSTRSYLFEESKKEQQQWADITLHQKLKLSKHMIMNRTCWVAQSTSAFTSLLKLMLTNWLRHWHWTQVIKFLFKKKRSSHRCLNKSHEPLGFSWIIFLTFNCFYVNHKIVCQSYTKSIIHYSKSVDFNYASQECLTQ